MRLIHATNILREKLLVRFCNKRVQKTNSQTCSPHNYFQRRSSWLMFSDGVHCKNLSKWAFCCWPGPFKKHSWFISLIFWKLFIFWRGKEVLILLQENCTIINLSWWCENYFVLVYKIWQINLSERFDVIFWTAQWDVIEHIFHYFLYDGKQCWSKDCFCCITVKSCAHYITAAWSQWTGLVL